jgi:hypothetical protein
MVFHVSGNGTGGLESALRLGSVKDTLSGENCSEEVH